MKMWSGRFRQPLNAEFERWQRSFGFDRRLLQYELAASGAHASALKNAGILSSDELISVLQGLEQIGKSSTASLAFLEDDEAEGLDVLRVPRGRALQRAQLTGAHADFDGLRQRRAACPFA